MGRANKTDRAPPGHFTLLVQLVLHNFGNGQLDQGMFYGGLQALLQTGTFGHAVVVEHFSFAIG